jgi:hypothetical protein
VQATLHNQHWKRDDGKAWTRAMFMPGYVPPAAKEDWKVTQAIFGRMAEQRKPITPEDRRAKRQMVQDRAARSERARLAGERGATSAEILEIMCGRA